MKGVSFTGFFGFSGGLAITTGFATAFTGLPLWTLFAGFAFAGLATFAFATGFDLATALGAGLLAFALGAGFFAAFFGCDFGMVKRVSWKEKGGIDTDFTPCTQGGNGNIFRGAPPAFLRRKKLRAAYELALP
jgi:hypothetical protein